MASSALTVLPPPLTSSALPRPDQSTSRPLPSPITAIVSSSLTLISPPPRSPSLPRHSIIDLSAVSSSPLRHQSTGRRFPCHHRSTIAGSPSPVHRRWFAISGPSSSVNHRWFATSGHHHQSTIPVSPYSYFDVVCFIFLPSGVDFVVNV